MSSANSRLFIVDKYETHSPTLFMSSIIDSKLLSGRKPFDVPLTNTFESFFELSLFYYSYYAIPKATINVIIIQEYFITNS